MPIQGQPTLLEQARNIFTTYKGTVGSGMSIADIAKIARVEPITLISSSVAGTPELYTILHGVLNIYAAYYLQAVSILSTQIHDSRVLKILDKTNPDRDLKTLLTSGQLVYESRSVSADVARTMSLEGCQYKLPMVKGSRIATESARHNEFGYDEDEYDGNQHIGAALARVESFDKLGMTVGKVIDVSFGETKQASGERGSRPSTATITLPVVVKLDTMVMNSEVVTAIATSNADEITFGSRFRDALAGRIGFIKDFLLCSDLIKAQKKTMIRDPQGFYSQLLKRVNNSKLYSAVSGNVSLAGISAIYVMSEQDEAEIQRKIGGRLTNLTTREIVFNNTSAMMLVVVDKEWQRVSIYIRDIDGFSQNSFDSFKSATDKNNNQIVDIMKALMMNNPAGF